MEYEINSKLQTLNEQEQVEYLLQCLPFIQELINKDDTKKSEEVTSLGIIKETTGFKKGDIYRRFMKKVYENIEESEEQSIFSCPYCHSMNIIYLVSSSEQVCGNCFAVDVWSLDTSVGFKEEQDMEKTIVYSYKRENHFNEWICQFQAKESTSVPVNIISDIKNELRKQKIVSKDEITHKKIKEILKKLGHSKYYEHIPYITTIVNGIKPPIMPQELEDRLRIMFHQIQEPFDRYCPKDRINFLSYSYVLYKFCELLGEDDYLPCFPLLKSKEKLYKHDQIWKMITKELCWQFIPTI